MTKLFGLIKNIKSSISENRYFKEILISTIFCITIYILSINFDLNEKWFNFTLNYEKFEIDELIFLLASITITLLFFSYRRLIELKSLTHKLNSISFIDQLTGLKNRQGFLSIAEKRLKLASLCSLLYIDLDRFKIINDTMGHTFGDLVLQKVSKRLVDCLSENDIISHHGGDEFIILLTDITQKEAAGMAKQILSEFARPFIVNDYEVFVSASIGIGQYPTDGENVEDLIKCADLAMYMAKDKGRNNFKFYTSALSKIISKKMNIENGLRKALDKNEFILYYQPQFNLTTGETIGVEALIRWLHPKLGLISPAEFIPVAEETGLIIPIGKWVLETACRQNKIWQDAGLPHVHIAVNISVQQLKHPDFVNTIRQVLRETKLEAKFLELEITESIMQNIEESTQKLTVLKSIGVKISIDDFGTGYSSLSILHHLPIDTLKIDQSFVNGILDDSNTSAIVNTIIDMGSNLKLNVIAEGIENKEQAHYLKLNNCSLGQGYFYCKPLPLEEFYNVLELSSTVEVGIK